MTELPIDPWSIIEPTLDLDDLGFMESLFALSNGHIGLRGNLDEGEPYHTPGSYLNGFFETLPLPYAEGGYGYPEEGQSILNVTNGKLFRLLVDDEPFDVRYGVLRSHRRRLDLRSGLLQREVEWVSPAGQAVRIRTMRMVSFVQRGIAAMSYEVEPLDKPARIVLQSNLVANEPIPGEDRDPRAAAVLRAPLIGEFHWNNGQRIALGHRTQGSRLRMAMALDHLVDGPDGTTIESESQPDLARYRVSTSLIPGETLRVVKLLATGWSGVRSMPALRDQVDAALSSARHTGWQGLVDEQRAYLDEIWGRVDIEIEGDPALQQAIRYAIFQIVQASTRAEQRAIPAKGLTGRGYDGHTFWDMDAYLLPVLTYANPHAARDILEWRVSTLDLARDRARELRLEGAAFPWRTIRGEECSGYWPAGTAAFHVNGAIAEGVRRYVAATGDTGFEEGSGFDLVIETARLFASLGHFDDDGNFRIDGVTGPDEYTALVDNNVYTNLLAARNLRTAAALAGRYPHRAADFGISREEIDLWLQAAAKIRIPFDHELGITAQSEGFTRYRRWDFEGTAEEDYPLLLHYPYYLLYSSQVIKQADLVFALYLFPDAFTPEQKCRDFQHYESITVRDSSLSSSIQSIVAAEVGYLDLALEYARESAFVDLHNLAGNSDDGLHLAAICGSVLSIVAGFGGFRDHGETVAFAPRLPDGLTRVSFQVLTRGNRIRVEITPDAARYDLVDGETIGLIHHGTPFTLEAGSPQAFPWPPAPDLPPVQPPVGREPGHRGIGREGANHHPPPGFIPAES